MDDAMPHGDTYSVRIVAKLSGGRSLGTFVTHMAMVHSFAIAAPISVVLLWILCCACSQCAAAPAEQAITRSTSADRRAVCGINAVYVFLRLHGVNVPYDEVVDELRLNPKGHSLTDMKRLTTLCHFPTKAYRGDIASIPDDDLPVIVHIRDGHVIGVGHFFVLLSKSGSVADCLDCTSGQREQLRIAWLQSHSLGAYLASATVYSQFTVGNLLALASFMPILPLGYYLLRPRVSVSRTHLSCLLGMVCFALASGTSHHCQGETAPEDSVPTIEVASSSDQSRRAECCAENAAYLFLRLSGVDALFSDVQRHLHRTTTSARAVNMLKMKKLLMEQGVASLIIRCTPDVLFSKCIPSLTLLDGERGTEDEYVLIIGSDERRVAIIHCGYVTSEFMDKDDFLRSWSGVALIREPRQSPVTSWALGFLGTGLLGSVLLWRRLI